VTTSLTPDQAREVVLASIVAVAPEVEPDELDETASLRDEVDLDSMDYLSVLQQIHDRTGVEIPESDYARLTSLADFVDYLAAP
jgi:acyl carrier protein